MKQRPGVERDYLDLIIVKGKWLRRGGWGWQCGRQETKNGEVNGKKSEGFRKK